MQVLTTYQKVKKYQRNWDTNNVQNIIFIDPYTYETEPRAGEYKKYNKIISNIEDMKKFEEEVNVPLTKEDFL